jgi:16S rRNA (guanine527-N7)-methyltransferase
MLGSSEPAWIVENVILDSFLFLRAFPPDVRVVADLGSGAGVPGIPVAIVRPDLEVTLIESRRRRASFLSTAVRELPLPNVRVVVGRAEDAPQLEGVFDVVLARCAGRVEEITASGTKLLRRGGALIIAGPPSQRELPGASWVEVPGVRPRSIRRFTVIGKP